MAYRTLELSFWQDNFVMDLTPEEKFFYIYLMTNSKSTQCGVYCLPTRLIEAETGYNRETCEKLIKRFVEYGKILYSAETKEIMLLNWVKHNFNSSINACKCMNKELLLIKNKEFVNTLYNIFKTLGYNTQVVFEGLINENLGSTEGVSSPLQAPAEPLGETINNKQETVNNKQDINNIYDLDGHKQPSVDRVDSYEDKEQEGNSTLERNYPSNVKSDKVPYVEIKELYNATCLSLPKIKELNESRKKVIRAVWNKVKCIEWFSTLFAAAENNKFLTGDNNTGWRADFDWLLKEKSYTKLLEGGYDYQKPSTSASYSQNKKSSGWNLGNQRGIDPEVEKALLAKGQENDEEVPAVNVRHMLSQVRSNA